MRYVIVVHTLGLDSWVKERVFTDIRLAIRYGYLVKHFTRYGAKIDFVKELL